MKLKRLFRKIAMEFFSFKKRNREITFSWKHLASSYYSLINKRRRRTMDYIFDQLPLQIRVFLQGTAPANSFDYNALNAAEWNHVVSSGDFNKMNLFFKPTNVQHKQRLYKTPRLGVFILVNKFTTTRCVPSCGNPIFRNKLLISGTM